MQKANVNWEDLKRDMHALRLLGLVRGNTSEEGVFYTITNSGLETLTHYEHVEEALASPKLATIRV